MKLPTSWQPVIANALPQGWIEEYGFLSILQKSDDTDEHELVVAGYASPQVVDRQKHLITREAMAKDLPRFLAHPHYRNAMVTHTNIQVGEVLPEWTNPVTGEKWSTHVDELGLFAVVKIRTDPARPAICKKVEADILSGKLRSFSISGDAPFESRQHVCENGTCFWLISEIEFYEFTICLTDQSEVVTSTGLRPIKDIVPGDKVLTHEGRFRPVTRTMMRPATEDLIAVTVENGKTISLTADHPVLIYRGLGRNIGYKKVWVPAGELKEGDNIVSYELASKKCEACGIPLVQSGGKSSMHSRAGKFCSRACRFSMPGNRAGKTLASGDPGVLRQSKALKGRPGKYYPHSAEGLAKTAAANQTEEFRAMRSKVQKEKWEDPDYWKLQAEARSMSPNKSELTLLSLIGDLGYLFTGDGKLVVGGKCPDFWNQNGHLVELYGDYWHQGENPQEREEFFAQRGYKAIVVWESELKKSPEDVRRRVMEFTGA